MHVIDSWPIFERYYRETHRKLDYLPRDLHWNAAAHDLAAQDGGAHRQQRQCRQLVNRITKNPPALREHASAMQTPLAFAMDT